VNNHVSGFAKQQAAPNTTTGAKTGAVKTCTQGKKGEEKANKLGGRRSPRNKVRTRGGSNGLGGKNKTNGELAGKKGK